jgi:putative peptidoglycan lipid II flippase
VLNVVFVGLLLSKDFEGPHAGLALARSAAAYHNAILLYRGLRKRQVYVPGGGWFRLWASVIIACVTMGSLLVFMTNDIDTWLQADAALRIKNLALSITFGVFVFVFSAMVTGLKKHDLVRGAK